ncbi:MAG TPA: TlpA disulfide reductase family protein [Thermoanaerobaculia bacterium]|jgi:thiol-disulfide isomerase/thioredoxin
MRNLIAIAAAALLAVAGCNRGEKTATAARGAQEQQQPKSAAQQQQVGTDVGATMPDYSAMWLDGSKFDLATKRDKVVLLNVWATWCGPCRFEIPALEAIHAKYKPRGFEVIGVSVDESGFESVKQFVHDNKMTYPVALDPEGRLAGIFQTSVLPTSVLLDREGKILWKKYGAILPQDEPELTKVVESAL